MPSRAQRAADAVFKRAFGRWLDQLESSENVSRQVHNAIAQRLARELRGSSASEVNRRIRAAFDAFERDRLDVIETAITRGAERGTGLTPSVARAVFGDAGARRALAPIVDDPAGIRARITARHMNGDIAVDAMSVRARLRTRTRETTNRMAAEVQESLRLGETTTETSLRMLRSTDIEVRIPRYIQRVRDAAAKANPSIVRTEVRRQLSRLQDGRIAEHNIASETRRFLDRVQRSKGADIDRAVDTWVRGRAQNQAMTIARTEGQAALVEAYVESTADQPWVVGYRWNLSPSHPEMDVCDVYANQDQYGLGPGGYPADALPMLAHPNDLCFMTAIIDEHHMERERAQRRGEAEPPRPWRTEGGVSGADWLRRQDARTVRSILGEGRAAEFARRPNKVVNANGSLNPLYRIQGRPPPERALGERRVHRAEQPIPRLGRKKR